MVGLIAQTDIKKLYPNDIGSINYFRFLVSTFVRERKYSKSKLEGSPKKKVRYYKITDLEFRISELEDDQRSKYLISEDRKYGLVRIKETIELVRDLDR